MLGALIGAGASILGGLMGKKAADKNIEMQKEFAQSGIQWKVADAKKAGVHPLYALGAQTHSFSPVSAGDSFGTAIGNAGQQIGRAVTATESQSGLKGTAAKLQIENMGLQNDLLRSQVAASKLATIRQGQTIPMPTAGDRMLIDGQSGSGLIDTSPMRRQSVAPGVPSHEAGAVSDVGFTRTPQGYMPVMSKDAKDRLDDDTIGMLSWNLRNRLLPSIGFNQNPPTAPVPEGYDAWIYNPVTQQYTPHKQGLFGIYY